MFTKMLSAKSILLFSLIPAVAFSAPSVGKVRSALGEVNRMKVGQTDWSRLSVGASIYQSDKVRTGVESEVIFGLADGSTITIAENAEVEMTSLFVPVDDGGHETQLDIKKGHVNFAVRKLQTKNSKFVFKTGTATASIRGTEGYIGGEGVFFAGLKTGKLEIVPEGSSQSVSIVAGETTFGTDSLVVVKLASSGDSRFAKKIEKILASNPKRPVAELKADLLKADSTFQQELSKEANAAAAALPANGFTLTTASPVEVCEEGFVVEGFYKTNDESASLTLKLGNGYQSPNLVKVADGNAHPFSHSVSISDENGLWLAEKAELAFVGGGASDLKTVDVQVSKVCNDVNRKAPTVVISSYDSLRCTANISIGEMQNDAAIFSVQMDGSPLVEEALTRNAQKRIKLSNGSHEYLLKAVDQAGNEVEVSKTMGCYPAKRFNIEVSGPAKEILKIPPPPTDIVDRIIKTLQFSIRIPENNPEFLYKVVVKLNGKIITQETLLQIQSLDYQVPLELIRGAANRVDVEVIHKSGYKAQAKKVYEVR